MTAGGARIYSSRRVPMPSPPGFNYTKAAITALKQAFVLASVGFDLNWRQRGTERTPFLGEQLEIM